MIWLSGFRPDQGDGILDRHRPFGMEKAALDVPIFISTGVCSSFIPVACLSQFSVKVSNVVSVEASLLILDGKLLMLPFLLSKKLMLKPPFLVI